MGKMKTVQYQTVIGVTAIGRLFEQPLFSVESSQPVRLIKARCFVYAQGSLDSEEGILLNAVAGVLYVDSDGLNPDPDNFSNSGGGFIINTTSIVFPVIDVTKQGDINYTELLKDISGSVSLDFSIQLKFSSDLIVNDAIVIRVDLVYEI